MFLQKRAAIASSLKKFYSGDLFGVPNASVINDLNLAGGGLVLIKDRVANTVMLAYDSARGDNNYLRTDSMLQQFPLANSVSLNHDGFSTGAEPSLYTNSMSWSFLKSRGFFDVVSYSGNGVSRSVPHGLGVVPGLLIVKRFNGGSGSWMVQHIESGASFYQTINTTDNETAAGVDIWNSQDADSNNFYLGANSAVNASGSDYVAYVFAHNPNKKIFCGSLIGNGNVNGPVANIGFKPKWILYKSATGNASNWAIMDDVRGMGSGNDNILYMNLTTPEETSFDAIAELSDTGFQIITTNSFWNGNGSKYIYMAIG